MTGGEPVILSEAKDLAVNGMVHTMAKKKKNKHQLQHQQKSSNYLPVRIDLEDDAEEIFLAAIEKINPQAIAHKDEPAADAVMEKRGRGEAATKSVITIDLHGHTLEEAQSEIDRVVLTLLRVPGQTHHMRIVTGKGIHSSGDAVLASEVHGYVVSRFQKYILRIQDSPHAVKVGGVPIRGHFDLVLQS